MPTYLPPDQRWSGVGQGLGALLSGILSGRKQKEVTDYAQSHPLATPEELYGKAGGDPHAHDLVTTILQGRLHTQQMEESKARAAKDAAEIPRIQAQTIEALTKTLGEQLDQQRNALKTKLLNAEIDEKRAAAAGKVDEAAMHRASTAKLKQEAANLEAGAQLIEQMHKNMAPQVMSATPGDADPSTPKPAGQTVPTPANAGYPEGSADFVSALDKEVSALRSWQKTPDGQGYDISTHAGGVSVTQKRGPPVTEKEQERIATMLSMAQVLGSVNDALIKDAKTGKLKLGPVKGALGQFISRFSKDPDDPNVNIGVMTGHADITASALLPNSRTGVNFLQLLKEIIVSPKGGAGFNTAALRNSLRILTNEAALTAARYRRERTLGADPDALEEIGKIARGAFTKSRADVVPKAGTPKEPSAKNAPKPGEVIDGYEFTGGDPADQKNWNKVPQ